MEIWNYLAGGAAVGVIAGFWGKIKDFAWKVISLFIARVELDSESAHNAVIAHLVTHYRRSRLYEPVFGAAREYHRDGRFGLVPCEFFRRRRLVFGRRLWPLVSTNAVEKKAAAARGNRDGGGGSSEAAKVWSTLTYLRGTVNVERLLRDACAASNRLAWSV